MSSISQDVLSRVISEFSGPDEVYKQRLAGPTFYQAYLDYTSEHPMEILDTVVTFDDLEEMNRIFEILYLEHQREVDEEDRYEVFEEYVGETGLADRVTKIAIRYGSKRILRYLVETYGILEFIRYYPMKDSELDLVGNPELRKYLAKKIHEGNVEQLESSTSRYFYKKFDVVDIINDNLSQAKLPYLRDGDPNVLSLAMDVLALDLGDERTSQIIENLNVDDSQDLFDEIMTLLVDSANNIKNETLHRLIQAGRVPLDTLIYIAEKLAKKGELYNPTLDDLIDAWHSEESYNLSDEVRNPERRSELIRILQLYDSAVEKPEPPSPKPTQRAFPMFSPVVAVPIQRITTRAVMPSIERISPVSSLSDSDYEDDEDYLML